MFVCGFLAVRSVRRGACECVWVNEKGEIPLPEMCTPPQNSEKSGVHTLHSRTVRLDQVPLQREPFFTSRKIQ